MTYQYRESRIAYAGTTRRIALDPLEFQGNQITALNSGDSITYTVFNEYASLMIPQTSALYSKIAEDTRNVSILAWNGLIHVGTTAQKISILWEVTMQGSMETFIDYIEVVASPLLDRTASVVASGYIN
jgi:hypothetical protein